MSRLATYLTNRTPRAVASTCLLLLSVLLTTPTQSEAQSFPSNITIEDGGRVWIEGSAGPVNYSCRARRLSGRGRIANSRSPESSITGTGEDITISVSLPVRSLDCGKRAMNRDMYGALKSGKFPEIHYHLLEATLAGSSADTLSDGWMTIRTRGIMEIAGSSDTTTVMVRGKVIEENKFHVKGKKELHMDTFDIDPPTAMFGLIRASKDLEVHFDVIVSLADTVSSLED